MIKFAALMIYAIITAASLIINGAALAVMIKDENDSNKENNHE